MKRKSNKLILYSIVLVVVLIIVAPAIWLWNHSGAYGYNLILRRGGTIFIPMKTDDKRLSEAMREALKPNTPNAVPGKYEWVNLAEGYQRAKMPVLVNGKEIDTIFLNRIDPKLYGFEVFNEYEGKTGIDEWEKKLPEKIFITNGSYYDVKGKPDTPFISRNQYLGPKEYNAKAGAFVVKNGKAEIIDLRNKDWKQELTGASNAMVSYPLLIGEDGQTHVNVKSKWLANRTFVAIDNEGYVVIGNTKDAFFSLSSLAEFLKTSNLGLKIALNLDGGPIACNSLRIGNVHEKNYAKWEAQVDGNDVRLLTWPRKEATWAMPVVITVAKK